MMNNNDDDDDDDDDDDGGAGAGAGGDDNAEGANDENTIVSMSTKNLCESSFRDQLCMYDLYILTK